MIHITAEAWKDVSCLYYSLTNTGYLLSILTLIFEEKNKVKVTIHCCD